MEFGEKIKEARKAAGYSQKDLSRATGISLRTIQNYESGERTPKKREYYYRLADALKLDVNILLDDTAEFTLQATEMYGLRGQKQAMKLTEQVAGLYAGGELAEEDMDAMMRAIQDAYWDAKKINKKYTPKKYRNKEETTDSKSEIENTGAAENTIEGTSATDGKNSENVETAENTGASQDQ